MNIYFSRECNTNSPRVRARFLELSAGEADCIKKGDNYIEADINCPGPNPDGSCGLLNNSRAACLMAIIEDCVDEPEL